MMKRFLKSLTLTFNSVFVDITFLQHLSFVSKLGLPLESCKLNLEEGSIILDGKNHENSFVPFS